MAYKGYWLGKKRSEETKFKISLSKIGKPSGGKGRVASLETRKKLSLSHMGKTGSLGSNWKGGKPKCTECGNILKSWNGTFCKSCSVKGNRNRLWKGGISKQKDYTTQMSRKRRVMEIGADGFHTLQDWELLKKQYGFKCPCCRRKEPDIKLTEDHIIPLIKGGSNFIENIQPLCRNCNSKKHIKIITFTFDKY